MDSHRPSCAESFQYYWNDRGGTAYCRPCAADLAGDQNYVRASNNCGKERMHYPSTTTWHETPEKGAGCFKLVMDQRNS